MQGTFEKKRDSDEGTEDSDTGDGSDNEGEGEGDSEVGTGKAATKPTNSTEKPIPQKQGRLEAISNVPWRELLTPGNDRDTQKRMRVHQEKEAQYNVLSFDQQTRKPKVMPYPQSPDGVFPGTPCYRVAAEGAYKFVFVVDISDPLIKAVAPPMLDGSPWDGRERMQSKGYWIVPHFIYRNENKVTNHRRRWEAIYHRNSTYNAFDQNIQNGRSQPMPSKFDFDSLNQLNAAEMPPAYQIPPFMIPPPVFVPGGVDAHDSYYVPGERNNTADAPEIKDPLFCEPFNTRQDKMVYPDNSPPIRFPNYTITPFPYNQPSPPFPQRPDPPIINAPDPVAPAPRRRRGPQAAPAQPAPRQLVVGIGMLDVDPPTYHGMAGVDWILQSNGNFEIGSEVLKDSCLQAEELDYAFALRMQGLRGVNLPAVWNCQDPAYDVTDRAAVLAQFVKMYMEKFYNRVEVGTSTSDVKEVIHEAMSMHEEFCKGWVERHHRTLSADIVSAAEALVGVFYSSLTRAFPQGVPMTRVHVARYLRRHPDLSGEFAYCLYHFMTSLEHLRGNRNASYRAMQGEKQSEITAMKRMGAMLQEKYAVIAGELSTVRIETLMFDPRFIDWHFISGQLPAHHKEFDGYLNSFSLFRTRPGGRGNQFPPWQQMRFRG